MSLSTITSVNYTLIILLITPYFSFGNPFPDWQDNSTFQSDLRNAALVANLPNHTGDDYYLGLSLSSSVLNDATLIPNLRVSIYPNLGYNLWTQFSKWPGENTNFSVGTGIQVEFQSENSSIRKAIGLSWNKAFANDFSQRDISIHALYGRASRRLLYGVSALLDMHHVLVDNNTGFADYDETFIQAVPYISWMVTEQSRLSLSLPLDAAGPGISVDYEVLLGKRE